VRHGDIFKKRSVATSPNGAAGTLAPLETVMRFILGTSSRTVFIEGFKEYRAFSQSWDLAPHSLPSASCLSLSVSLCAGQAY